MRPVWVPGPGRGKCLGEAEDVVDEEEHILALSVAEVLSHGQACA